MLLLSLAFVALLSTASTRFCKREAYGENEYGYDACDTNGFSCCYRIHNGTVIIYSHNYNNGTYNPNTHCQYIIDVDDDCDINVCYQYEMSIGGGGSIKIGNKDTQIEVRSDKRPFDFAIDGSSISVNFESDASEPKEGSKWAIGFVCVPKAEYKSVCEVCDGLREEMDAGPVGDAVVKVIE